LSLDKNAIGSLDKALSLKLASLSVDTINEKTSGSGVTIDSALNKDGVVPSRAIIFSGSGITHGGSGPGYIGLDTIVTADEAEALIPIPVSGTFKNLYVNLAVAPGAGKTRTLTLRVGGADQALTVTISNTDTTGNDVTHTVAVSAGDLICIGYTSTGTPATSEMKFGLEFEPS